MAQNNQNEIWNEKVNLFKEFTQGAILINNRSRGEKLQTKMWCLQNDALWLDVQGWKNDWNVDHYTKVVFFENYT